MFDPALQEVLLSRDRKEAVALACAQTAGRRISRRTWASAAVLGNRPTSPATEQFAE